MKNFILAALLLITAALSAQCPPSHEPMAERYILNDSLISQEMAILSQQTTIQLCYNSVVRTYIDLYINRRNEQTDKMLFRSYSHFPIIEVVLEQHKLPDELKYYAMVESAMNPKAVSRNGCKGLWQLSSIAAQLQGLTDNDCFDPTLATDAACRILESLFSRYDDWLLALSAYDLGTATVDRAIAQGDGSRDYWIIRKHLPREVQGYIPAFMAIIYVMKNPDDFGLHPMCPRID